MQSAKLGLYVILVGLATSCGGRRTGLQSIPDHLGGAPTPEALVADATRQYMEGKYVKAAELYSAASLGFRSIGLTEEAVDASVRALWSHNASGSYYRTIATVDSLAGAGRGIVDSSESALGQAALLAVLGDALVRTGQYNRAEDVLSTSLHIRKTSLGIDDVRLAESLHLMGFVRHMREDPKGAEPFYEKALEIRQRQLGPSIETAQSLNNLGNVNYMLGHYGLAKQYHEAALSIRRSRVADDHPVVAASLGNLGNVYFETGDFQNAIELYQQAASIWLASIGPNSVDLAFSYHNLGNAYQRLSRNDVAIGLIRRAIDIESRVTGDSTLNYIYATISLSKALLAVGEVRAAVDQLQKSRVTLGSYQSQSGEAERAWAIAWASALRANGAIQEAENLLLKTSQESMATRAPLALFALNQLAENYRDVDRVSDAIKWATTSLDYNRELARTRGVGIDQSVALIPSEYFRSIETLTQSLLSQAAARKDRLGYEQILSTLLAASNAVVELRERVRGEGDELPYAEAAGRVFAVGVRVGFWLWKATGERQFLDAAYHFAERSRGGYLLDGMTENSARKLAGVPAEVLRQDRQLQLDISRAEYRLEQSYSGIAPARSDSQIARLRQEVFRLREEHQRRVAVYAVEYPTYFAFRHDHRVASVESLREKVIDPSVALVEYMVESDTTFVFVITSDDVGMTAVATPPNLEVRVDSLVEAIRTDDVRAFLPLGREMYRRFVEPTLRWVGDRDLLVAVDGPLARLPFSVLLDEEPIPQEFGWSEYPYMVKNRAISYTFSPTLLELTRKPPARQPSKALFAMAPMFEESRSVPADRVGVERPGAFYDFPELPGTLREVEGLRKLFEASRSWSDWLRPGYVRVLQGSDATEGAIFRNRIADYRYVHLASHGFASRRSGQYSGLLLEAEEDSGDDGILFASEVYAMTLNAELVTLSACETAIGPVRKGEGVIDLTRAFFYAGARNALVTLWPSDDDSSVPFMMAFYEDAIGADRFGRSVALAQRALIADGASFSAPRHWAPFILVGK